MIYKSVFRFNLNRMKFSFFLLVVVYAAMCFSMESSPDEVGFQNLKHLPTSTGCKTNEDLLRNTVFNTSYCFCKAGFKRSGVHGPCIICNKDVEVCPRFSDNVFACPENSDAILPDIFKDKIVDFKRFNFCKPHAGFDVSANFFTSVPYRVLLYPGETRLYQSVISTETCLHSPFEKISSSNTCQCASGYYRAAEENSGCLPCPANHYCIAEQKYACNSDLASPEHSSSQAACQLPPSCAPGYFLDPSNAGTCIPCPIGFFCKNSTRNACPSRSQTLYTESESASACICERNFLPIKIPGTRFGFSCKHVSNQIVSYSNDRKIFIESEYLRHHVFFSGAGFSKDIVGFVGAVDMSTMLLFVYVVFPDTWLQESISLSLAYSGEAPLFRDCRALYINAKYASPNAIQIITTTVCKSHSLLHNFVFEYDELKRTLVPVTGQISKDEMMPFLYGLQPARLLVSVEWPARLHREASVSDTHANTFSYYRTRTVQVNKTYSYDEQVLDNLTFTNNIYSFNEDFSLTYTVKCHWPGMSPSSATMSNTTSRPFHGAKKLDNPTIKIDHTGRYFKVSFPCSKPIQVIEFTQRPVVLFRNAINIVKWGSHRDQTPQEFSIAPLAHVRQKVFNKSTVQTTDITDVNGNEINFKIFEERYGETEIEFLADYDHQGHPDFQLQASAMGECEELFFQTHDCSEVDARGIFEDMDTRATWPLGFQSDISHKRDKQNGIEFVAAEAVACSENQVSHANGTACVCKDGFHSDGGGPCKACRPGQLCHLGLLTQCDLNGDHFEIRECACPEKFFFNGTTCKPCPTSTENKYSICANGALVFCPDGSVRNHDATSCVCRDGYYSEQVSGELSACFLCPVGFFCVGGIKTKCGSGRTTAGPGSTAQEECKCKPGFEPTADTCSECTIGKFKPDIQSQSCSSCSSEIAGSVTLQVASTDKAQCVCPDKFKLEQGECVVCMENELCLASTSPRECSRVGDDEVVDYDERACSCAPGFYRSSQSERCRLCPRGFYCTAGGIIFQCPAGTLSNEGSHSEHDCFCSKTTQVFVDFGMRRGQCLCSSFYKQEQGACAACPANSRREISIFGDAVNEGECTCESGFYRTTDETCSVCLPGSFCQGSNGNQQMQECPAGTFSSHPALTSGKFCTMCGGTHRMNMTGLTSGFFCNSMYLPISFDSDENIFDNEASFFSPIFTLESISPLVNDTNTENTLQSWLGTNYGIIKQGELLSNGRRSRSYSPTSQFQINVWRYIFSDSELASKVRNLAVQHLYHHELILDLVFCFLMDLIDDNRYTLQKLCEVKRKLSPGLENDFVQFAVQVTQQLTSLPVSTPSLPLLNLDISDVYKMMSRLYSRSENINLPKASLTVLNAIYILPMSKNVLAIVSETTDNTVLRKISLLLSNSEFSRLTFYTRSSGPTADNNLCSMPLEIEGHNINKCGATLLKPNIGLCETCIPGKEFRDRITQKCTPCSVLSDCDNKQECCGYQDTTCLDLKNKTLTVEPSRCGNGLVEIELGEECDYASDNTPNCCDSNCKILPGYLLIPRCQTVCGDGIIAGSEVCDDPLDSLCNKATCKCHHSAEGLVKFDHSLQRCVQT